MTTAVVKETMAGLAQMGFGAVCKDFGVTLGDVAREMVTGSCDHETATIRLAERKEARGMSGGPGATK